MTQALWLPALLLSVATAWLPGATTQPSITLSPTSGQAGTAVTIKGSGFPPGEIVALYIDSPDPFLGQPGPRADADGAFHLDIKFPGKAYDRSGRIDPSTPGPHNICGDTAADPGRPQPVAAKACAQFMVLGPPSPIPNTTVQDAPVPLVLIAVAILAVLALGAALWLRRAKP